MTTIIKQRTCTPELRLQFRQKSEKRHGMGLYDFTGAQWDGDSHSDVTLRCLRHDHTFHIRAYRHYGSAGRGCQLCTEEKRLETISGPRLTTAQFVQKAKKLHGEYYDYSETVYLGDKLKISVKCPAHGEFQIHPNYHIRKADKNNRPSGCPQCGRSKTDEGKRLSNTIFEQRSREIHGDKYDYSDVDYHTYEKHVSITCKACVANGNGDGKFTQSAQVHIRDTCGCPTCGSNTYSKSEEKISNLLKANGIAHDVGRYDLITNTETKRKLQLDIYIAEANVAIEVHGNLYHSEAKRNPSDARTHIFRKFDECNKIGLQLLQFYEDEVKLKWEIVERMILHKISRSKSEKVFARKCSIEYFKKDGSNNAALSEIADEFMSSNHLQGKTMFIDGCVLLHCDEIVGMMLFNRVVSSRGATPSLDEVELVRMAFSKNVVGGASRMFKEFIRNRTDVKKIYSYSDNRISTGDVYEKLCFTADRITDPSYAYVHGRANGSLDRYHKTRFKRKNQQQNFPNFNPEMTEVENAAANDFYRLWDAGKVKWMYEV